MIFSDDSWPGRSVVSINRVITGHNLIPEALMRTNNIGRKKKMGIN